MWSEIYKIAALVLLSTISNGQLPEDDFRIINKQGKISIIIIFNNFT